MLSVCEAVNEREREWMYREVRERGREGGGERKGGRKDTCIEMFINELVSQLKFTLRYGTLASNLANFVATCCSPRSPVLLLLVVLGPLLPFLVVVVVATPYATVVASQVRIEKLMRFSGLSLSFPASATAKFAQHPLEL